MLELKLYSISVSICSLKSSSFFVYKRGSAKLLASYTILAPQISM